MKSHIDLDYEKVRVRALNAIGEYLSGRQLSGDRDGLYHGIKGQNRAAHLKKYLIALKNLEPTQKKIGILTVLYAVMVKKSFLGVAPGRSSRLAGLIGEKWIHGSSRFGAFIEYNNSLRSSIISKDMLGSLDTMSNCRVVPNGEASWGYFDHTKAARSLLKAILKTQEFQNYKEQIIAAAKILSVDLEKSYDEQMPFTVNLSIIKQIAEGPSPVAIKKDVKRKGQASSVGYFGRKNKASLQTSPIETPDNHSRTPCQRASD